MSAEKPFVVHWRCTKCQAAGTAVESKTGESGEHMRHLRVCKGGLETSLRGWAA